MCHVITPILFITDLHLNCDVNQSHNVALTNLVSMLIFHKYITVLTSD